MATIDDYLKLAQANHLRSNLATPYWYLLHSGQSARRAYSRRIGIHGVRELGIPPKGTKFADAPRRSVEDDLAAYYAEKQGVGDRIMQNLSESRFGKYLSQISTVSYDPSTARLAELPASEGLAERTGENHLALSWLKDKKSRRLASDSSSTTSTDTSGTPLSSLPAGVQHIHPQQLSPEVTAAPTSPQANFLARQATGIPPPTRNCSSTRIVGQWNNLDPPDCYSREPFLAQQAAQAAQAAQPQASFPSPRWKHIRNYAGRDGFRCV